MTRIKSFNTWQTAKVAGVIYLVLAALVVSPITLLTTLLGRNPNMMAAGLLMALLMPAAYALLGFLGTALSCAIYNRVSAHIGGIEVEIETAPAVDGAGSP